MTLKSKKIVEENKILKKIEQEAGKEFSLHTIQLFGLNERVRTTARTNNIRYDLNAEIKQLEQSPDLNKSKRIDSRTIDRFLYSGKLNSVIGLDGFSYFKDVMLDSLSSRTELILKDEDRNHFKNIVTISGIYFEYSDASKELVDLYNLFDQRAYQRAWLLNSKNDDFIDLDLYRFNFLLERSSMSISQEDFMVMKKTIEMTSDLLFKEFSDFLENKKEINLISLYRVS